MTEAFIIRYGQETAHIHIDRNYRYGCISLIRDNSVACLASREMFLFYDEVNLVKFLDKLQLKNGTLSLEVDKNCDERINRSVHRDKYDDILTLVIKEGIVIEVTNSSGELVYSPDIRSIRRWDVGWFGKVYDYYTGIVSNDVEWYKNHSSDGIFGLFFLY